MKWYVTTKESDNLKLYTVVTVPALLYGKETLVKNKNIGKI